MRKDVKKLTKSGYADLQRELSELIHVENPKIDIQLAEARAQGDYSENSDLDAARKRKAEILARIAEIEDILATAQIIDSSRRSNNKISLGSTVSFRNIETGKESTYTIVDSIESNPFENRISQDCVVGSAILGKIVGDIVEIKTANPYKIEILEIK